MDYTMKSFLEEYEAVKRPKTRKKDWAATHRRLIRHFKNLGACNLEAWLATMMIMYVGDSSSGREDMERWVKIGSVCRSMGVRPRLAPHRVQGKPHAEFAS